MTKSTLKLLHDNRQTHRSLISENVDTLKMAVDSDPKQQAEEMAALIDQVVGSNTKWAGQRASKLTLEDLLELLTEFHSHGIHFA